MMTNDDDAHGAKAAAVASEAGQPALMINDDAHRAKAAAEASEAGNLR